MRSSNGWSKTSWWKDHGLGEGSTKEDGSIWESGCFGLTKVTEDEEDDPSETAPISSNCTIFIPTSRDTHK